MRRGGSARYNVPDDVYLTGRSAVECGGIRDFGGIQIMTTRNCQVWLFLSCCGTCSCIAVGLRCWDEVGTFVFFHAPQQVIPNQQVELRSSVNVSSCDTGSAQEEIFAWLGDGIFDEPALHSSIWTAPAAPGVYGITATLAISSGEGSTPRTWSDAATITVADVASSRLCIADSGIIEAPSLFLIEEMEELEHIPCTFPALYEVKIAPESYLTMVLRVPFSPGCGMVHLDDYEFELGTLSLHFILEGTEGCPSMRPSFERSLLVTSTLEPSRVEAFLDGELIDTLLVEAR